MQVYAGNYGNCTFAELEWHFVTDEEQYEALVRQKEVVVEGETVDEVEGGAITAIGVSQGAEWYKQSVALLKARVEAELRETIDGTRAATGVQPPAGSASAAAAAAAAAAAKPPAMSTPAEVAAVEEEFKDGEKLQTLLNTIDEQVLSSQMQQSLQDEDVTVRLIRR